MIVSGFEVVGNLPDWSESERILSNVSEVQGTVRGLVGLVNSVIGASTSWDVVDDVTLLDSELTTHNSRSFVSFSPETARVVEFEADRHGQEYCNVEAPRPNDSSCGVRKKRRSGKSRLATGGREAILHRERFGVAGEVRCWLARGRCVWHHICFACKPWRPHACFACVQCQDRFAS